jgi:hypothetical protein
MEAYAARIAARLLSPRCPQNCSELFLCLSYFFSLHGVYQTNPPHTHLICPPHLSASHRHATMHYLEINIRRSVMPETTKLRKYQFSCQDLTSLCSHMLCYHCKTCATMGSPLTPTGLMESFHTEKESTTPTSVLCLCTASLAPGSWLLTLALLQRTGSLLAQTFAHYRPSPGGWLLPAVGRRCCGAGLVP